MPKTVREIVIEYLKANGYDGLYCDDCGCGIDDLMPCGEFCAMDCKPAMKNMSPCYSDICRNSACPGHDAEMGEFVCYGPREGE